MLPVLERFWKFEYSNLNDLIAKRNRYVLVQTILAGCPSTCLANAMPRWLKLPPVQGNASPRTMNKEGV